MQLSNSILLIKLSLESKEPILSQYEVNILFQPIYFDQIYHFACHFPLEITFYTCHLYHLFTS